MMKGSRGIALSSLLFAIACTKSAAPTDKPIQTEPPPTTPSAKTTEPPKPETTAGIAMPTNATPVGDLNKVGRVDLPITCKGQQETFDRALALLHSFFYQEARRQFAEIAAKDPQCAIAHWGVAMSWWHPLWSPPTPEDFDAGHKALLAAQAATTKSDREKAFVDALAAYYTAPAAASGGAGGMSCHGPTEGHSDRAQAYTTAMEKVYAGHKEDVEESAFYALALLGSAKPVDPTLENQRKAADILEKFWKTRRDHPGVAHYLIHAYDSPQLAEKGLDAAKSYAAIAPRVAHALHMPTHIYTRLGMWSDSAEGNRQSMSAAKDYITSIKQEGMSFDELHALDYLVYAYLQTGQEQKAKELVDYVGAVKQTIPAIDFVASYAMGAIPARFAVERHDWKAAANLPISTQAFWAKFPFTEGHIEYARALGRARSGDLEGAKKSLARLAELHAATTDKKFEYFKKHLELQQQAVSAWIAHAEGKNDEAIATLKKAAETEELLGKHPVSPGPIILIGEQLGDLYLELNKPAEALAAFETVLKSSRNRLDAMLGAAQAAEKAGKADVAKKYFQQAVDQTKEGDSTRPDLVHAKDVLAKN